MLTGEIRSQIDQIWNAFWSGGISNPLEVIEQITYLLFLKRLDEQETAEELKANREKKPMQKRFFPVLQAKFVVKSIKSGTPSGQAASPIRSKSLSKSPTFSFSSAWTSRKLLRS